MNQKTTPKQAPAPMPKLSETPVSEKWLISWRPNSDYISQTKLPAGHTETVIHDGRMDHWVRDNPQKTVVFCIEI